MNPRCHFCPKEMPEYWVQAWYDGKVVESEYACKRHLEAWVSTLLRLNDGVEIQKARWQHES